MSELFASGEEPAVDVGGYCRAIEAHLTRVNDGQIIRIVGPAFELARGWAHEGIPLSIVCHGIDLKAERHRAGRARRALRLEFCEPDVIAAYERWRRAVGIPRMQATPGVDGDEGAGHSAGTERRSESPTRRLDRAIERLSRVVGRLDRSDRFREAVSAVFQDAASLREAITRSRGAARAALLGRLPALDQALVDAGRSEVGPEGLRALEQQAAGDLAAFRGRLAPAAWEQSVGLGVIRLLRDELDLPALDEP